MQSQLRAGIFSWLLVLTCIIVVVGFAGDAFNARQASEGGPSGSLRVPPTAAGTSSAKPSNTSSATGTSSPSGTPTRSTPSSTSSSAQGPSSHPATPSSGSSSPPGTATPSNSSASNSPSAEPGGTFPEVPADYVLPAIHDGMVPVLTKVPTKQKIVFLTIDDGANKTQQQIDLLKSNNIKATLFLAQLFILNNPDYFKGFLAEGSKIENHSISHPLNLIKLPHGLQKKEICQMSDYEQQQYGRRPVFFRPPGGPYTLSLRKVAAQCGIKAIVDWNVEVRAGRVNYQEGKSLTPGDIVLMHFRKEFPQDLQAFLTAQRAAGLKVVLLEDFLAVS